MREDRLISFEATVNGQTLKVTDAPASYFERVLRSWVVAAKGDGADALTTLAEKVEHGNARLEAARKKYEPK